MGESISFKPINSIGGAGTQTSDSTQGTGQNIGVGATLSGNNTDIPVNVSPNTGDEFDNYKPPTRLSPAPNTIANSYISYFWVRNYSYAFSNNSYVKLKIGTTTYTATIGTYTKAEMTVYPTTLTDPNIIGISDYPWGYVCYEQNTNHKIYNTSNNSKISTYTNAKYILGVYGLVMRQDLTGVDKFVEPSEPPSGTSTQLTQQFRQDFVMATGYKQVGDLYEPIMLFNPINTSSIPTTANYSNYFKYTPSNNNTTYSGYKVIGVCGVKFPEVTVALQNRYTEEWMTKKSDSDMYPDVEASLTRLYTYAYNYSMLSSQPSIFNTYIDIYDNIVTAIQTGAGKIQKIENLEIESTTGEASIRPNTFTTIVNDLVNANTRTVEDEVNDDKNKINITLVPIIHDYYVDSKVRNLYGNAFSYISVKAPSYTYNSTSYERITESGLTYGNIELYTSYLVPTKPGNDNTSVLTGAGQNNVIGSYIASLAYNNGDKEQNYFVDLSNYLYTIYDNDNERTSLHLDVHNMMSYLQENAFTKLDTSTYADNITVSFVLDNPMIPIKLSAVNDNTTYNAIVDYTPKEILYNTSINDLQISLNKSYVAKNNQAGLSYIGPNNDVEVYSYTDSGKITSRTTINIGVEKKRYKLLSEVAYKDSLLTITSETPGNSVSRDIRIKTPIRQFEYMQKNYWETQDSKNNGNKGNKGNTDDTPSEDSQSS